MSTSTDRLTSLDSPGERRFYPRSTPSRPIYVPFGANNLCMLLNLSENGFLISTPAVPVISPPPKRPPAPRIAAARASATGAPIAELQNKHLDALRSRSAVVARRRRKKSEALALIAWILVGAVTCVGIALLMRPE